MKCPVCRETELASELLTDLEIDRCQTCGGLWLDATELERLVTKDVSRLLKPDGTPAGPADPRRAESGPADSAAGGGKPRRLCPRCGGVPLIRMTSRLGRGALIDSCTVCFGNWVDRDGLSRLARRGVGAWLLRLFGR